MRFLPRLALFCGALLFLFGASARPAAAQSGAIGIRGDVTADGNLTASDALAVLSHVVGKPLPAGYSAELDGDADGNGQVTALDALVILGRVVGKDVARYPVGRRLLSGVVGTAGGSVVSRLDSIRIEFPEGALAEAVNITVEPATGLPATPGLVASSALSMGPDGQRFAKPVRLTLRYSPAAVPQGVDPAALRIHRRVGDGWEEVPGGTVDVASATVSAVLSGFSTYAILPRAETGLSLVKVAGDGQTGTVGLPPADFLVVRLVNPAGRGIANRVLTWTVIEGGGTIRPLEERTDSAGRVRAVFTLGPDAGLNRVRVATAGADPVVFTATGVSAAPSSIVVYAGADQTATAGGPVATPPSVRVTDARGNPVVDATVTFAVATGGGSITGATPKTDGNGIATVGSWTLGTTAGPNSLTASVAGGLSVTINATGIPGAPASISKQSGDGGTAVVGTTRALEAKVVDANGNGVAGVTVSWTVASGGGSLSAPSSLTDGSGVASVIWTFGGTAGAQSVTAAATGLAGSPLTFSATTTPAAASRLAITTQPSAAAQSGIAFPQQPVLQLQDAFGNAVAQSGVAVTAAIASGTGTLGGTATVSTNAAGVATFADLAISGPVGAYTLGFSATGLTGATSGTINLAAGAASQLAVTTQPSATAQSGVAFPQQPVVQLRDAAGNPVSQAGVTVTAAIATGGGTLGGTTTATTNASGVATFTNLSITGTVGDRTLAFSATGLTGATSGTITLTAGAASQLAVTTQPSATAQSGVAFPQQPVVQLRDASGNPVAQAGVTVTAAIATGGGTLGGTTTATTDAGGAATFTGLSITGTIGDRTLSFSATGLTGATSNTISVTAGAATQLTITTQPSSTAQSGAVFGTQPAVQLRDASGNPVAQAGVTVTAAIASGAGTLGGTTTATTNASGVATFTDLAITGVVGDRTLSFSATGLTGATSNTISVTAGAATQLAITTQPSDSVQSGTAFPRQPVVQLRDASGNPVAQAGVTVTAAIASGAGTLGGTTAATTNASGVATFTNLVITGSVGDRTLSFSATGLTGATSGTVNVRAGAASQLAITTQPSPTAQSGVAFGTQPAVQVQDASGNPIAQAGVTVTAAIATGGGTLGGTTTATTNASGVATFTNLSISGTVGDRTLSFSASGLTGATSNTISVTAGAATQLAITTQPSSTAESGVAFATQPAVQLQDASGNPVAQAGVTVTAAIASGAGTLGGTTTATTNASGVATFTNLQITGVLGDRTLSFSASGLTGATSNTVSVTAGAATQLTITTQPSDSVQSGTTFPRQPVVQLRDASGNPVAQAGVTVTAAIASGAGTLGGTTTATTNGSGVATFTNLVITGAVGDRTISFSASGLTGATSNTVSVTAGAASQLTITTQPSDSVQSGTTFPRQPVVQLRDASGNPVAQAGVTVTAAIASGAGTLGGTTTATTNASGVATFTNLVITGAVGDRTLSFSASGLTGATSNTVSVTAGAATQLAVTTQPSSTAQSGVAFATQPAVQIQDASGNPVAQAGVTVTAAIASGAGTLGGTTTATTNASGVATFTDLAITGVVGDRTLSFSATGLTSATSNTISVTAGAATQLAITTQPSDSVQSGTTFPRQPVVQLRDASGNPVAQAGVTVTVAIASGAGTLGGTTTATTNASGVATFTDLVITGVVGDRTLSFSATGLTGATSNTVSVTAGGASQLVITTQPSDSVQSGTTFPRQPVVQLRDASGNPVAQAGVTVTAAIATGGGTLGGTTTATTNASGVATFTNLSISGTVGDRTLSFSATGLTGATSSTISVTAGAASQLTITTQPSDSVQSGTTFPRQPAVQLRDASGNPVAQAGVTVTAAIATGGGTLGGTTTATTNASGVATFTNLSITGAVGDRTLSFSAAGLTGATSSTVSVTAGAAAQLAVTTQPSATVQSGVAFPQQPVVQLRDAAGNPVAQAGVTVTAAIASGGGTLGGTTTATTDATGAATFTDLSITGTVGDRTLSFSASGLTGATSNTISVTAGAATQLGITTQPSDSVQSGIAFPRQPVVQLRDASGNPVSQAGVTVTAAIASGAGTLGGTTTATTNASGVATFTDLSITGLVGDRTLSFSASGLTGATSATVSVTAGAASQLVITTQPSDSVQGGAPFPRQPVVRLLDASGNPVAQAGVTVTAAIASGGGTLGGTTTATTNASGVATFTNLSISGAAGDRTLSFSATGLTGATSTTVRVTSGPPAQLFIATQPSSSAQAGVAFAQQPAVQLQDASGNPTAQAGVVVTAAIASGGGTLGGTVTATTDATGLATFTNLSIGGTVGSRTLSFSASGLTGATSGTINVTAGPAAALAFSVQPSNVVASAPITPAVQVSIVDAYGNVVTGATDNVTLAIGNNPSGGTLSGTTTVAATGGVATFSGLSINLVGTGYTLTASAAGLGTATSVGFNVTHGPLDHFLVEAAGGGPIGNQLAGTPFNVRVTAKDAFNNTVTSFTGTVGFTSTPAGGISAGATSGAFTAGVLSSHAITFGTPGSFTLTATRTSGTESGTSNSFEVQAAPTAVNEGPTPTSAPGQPFHAFFSTSGSPQTFSLAAPGVLSNDNLGFPLATITSFGADSLGGSVTTYAAGSTVSPLPGTGRTTGSLSVGANGTITFTPPDGFTGNYVFKYRLTNVRGFSDGQVTIAVGARPAAANDTYAPVLLGNVPINTATSTQFRVTSNDAGDGKILAITGQSNGTATLNADSTFVFRPNPGFEGTASFTYTVRNGFGTTAPATVTMTVANPVWFVDASASAGGDGRYDARFNSLSSFAAINNGTGSNPAANDRVFLYTGAYTGAVTLLNGQQFVGQGATGSSFSSVLGVTWPADSGTEPGINGTSPTITSATTGITLGSGNTLRGFNLGNVTGTALSGTSFGTVVVSSVGINTTGQALSLTTGTLNGGFTQLRSTGGTNNVFLSGVATTGTSTLGGAGDVLSGATGDAFVVAGGTGSFTYSGSVTQASNAALLNVSGGHSGTLTFQTGTLSATNGTGLQFNNADGSYAFTGTATLNGGNAGIDVTNGSSGTFSFPSTASITNPTAETVNISNSAPSFTYAGSLTKTGSASTGITLNSNTGGTIAFSGATKVFSTLSANAVNMLSNAAGVTVSFADSLRITTTTGVGFNATGGGTVTVAGTNNSITAAGGAALNVASTTIGAGGLNFRSISANGGASGIVLNSTGSAGRLQVTGSGTASSGGTIQNTTSHGISLTSTTNPAFDRMNLQSNGGSGVFGTGVVGFTLTNSTIATSGSGGGANASNIDFFADAAAGTENNLSGTVVITGNTLSAPAFHSVDIQNWSGTISDLTLSNNTITNNSTLGGGIRVIAIGGAGNVAKITRATIAGNQITGTMQSPGLQVQCGNADAGGPLGECGTEGSGTNVVAITNNQVHGAGAASRMGTEGLLALLNGRGQANFNVSTNDVRHTTGRAMAVTVFGQGRMTATVANNTIVANNTFAAAGMEIGADSTANMASFASYRATVTGNNISQTDGVGIYAIARGSSDSLRVKLQNNTIAAPLTGVRPGLRVDSGSTNSNTWVCANISGNTTAGSGGTQGIGLRKQGTSTSVNVFGVHGMAATATPGVESYVSGLNPAGNGVLLISATSGFSNCSFP